VFAGVSLLPLGGQTRTVKIGVFPAAPLVLEKDGKPEGLFIDLIDQFSLTLGWRVQYVPDTWSNLLALLEKGEIDLLPAVGYTRERASKYDFSRNPVYIDSGVLFTGKKFIPHTIFDLQGKKVAAVDGSIFTSGFIEYVSTFGLSCEIVLTRDNREVMQAISGGSVDAGVCIYSLGNELAKEYPVLITPISFSPIALSFAVPKGKNVDLISGIDRLMEEMVDDPESLYSRSFRKWTIPSPSKELPIWLLWGLLGLLLVGLSLAFWSYLLKRQVKLKTAHLEIEIAERKRAEEILSRQSERLRKLHEIDLAILAGGEALETIAGKALRHVRILLSCRQTGIGIFMPEENEVRIVIVAENGLTNSRVPRASLDKEFGDLGAIEIRPEKTNAEGERSFLNIPLISVDTHIGVLNLQWEKPRVLANDTLEIAVEVGGQITIAIEQARLRNETQRHATELEKRVKERTELLESANQELDAFSYSVSHDLRAPLRAIDGFVRILVEDFAPALGDEGKRICSVINDGTDRMGCLIDNLLAFSHIGRAALVPVPVEMEALCRSTFMEITTAADRERIVFNLDHLAPAIGDPALLRQVWVNLLGNAVKYSSKKTEAQIEVNSELRDDGVVYSVNDNGAGFNMDYADKLFGVFQRLHSQTEFPGTGVGLAIVQRIILRHRGKVWAEGETNKGATFHFSLPVGEA